MKVHALPVLTLILASGSVQAQNGYEPMMNPMAFMNPTGMFNPLTMLTPMLGAGMMPNPQQFTNPYLNPYMNPTGGMGNSFMNPMGGMGNSYLMPPQVTPAQSPSFFSMMPFPQQAPAQGYGVPAYGGPAGPAPSPSFFPMMPFPQQAPAQGYGAPTGPTQGGFMPFFPAAPAPQQATAAPTPTPQPPAPNMFDPSAWMKMFPNSMPPNPASSGAPQPAQPAPAAQ
jgi:hypothetical protein